ncbi:MAG: hypothetical protein IJX78_02435 [Bacilli bacterium]|nr:hypothetical protein [Bacilli bacterium]
MSEFVDRKGTNLNKKKLKIVDIVRDVSTGEISELYVEEFRDDSVGLESVGTAITAANLNTIIKSMIESEVYHQLNKTDEEKVTEDAQKLTIDTLVDDNFDLPSVGYNGSTITWSVVSGTAINISLSKAIVVRGTSNSVVTLKAVIKNGTATATKNFSVTVLAREKTDTERVNADAEAISVPSSTTSSFTLSTLGTNGSTITWSVYSGTGIVVNNGMAYVTRASTDSDVTLKAIVKYNTTSVTKYYNVTVLAEEVVEVTTDFSPKTFSTSWTQEYGNLRSANLTIGSSDTSALYIDVENDDSASINVVVNTNSSSLVRLTVSETSGLNSLVGYTTPVFTFYVHVYLDNDRSVKLGTLTGTVTYHFSSVTPDD